jgi:hypothetical protein
VFERIAKVVVLVVERQPGGESIGSSVEGLILIVRGA